MLPLQCFYKKHVDSKGLEGCLWRCKGFCFNVWKEISFCKKFRNAWNIAKQNAQNIFNEGWNPARFFYFITQLFLNKATDIEV